MNEFLLRILGIDPATVPPDAEATPVWTNADLLASWRAFVFVGVAAALVWGVFWLYRREIVACPRRVRLLLAVLRSAVLLVLAAVLLGPALAISLRQQLRPYVLVMLDESASMALRDRYQDDEAVRPVSAALGRSADQVRADPPRRAAIINHLVTGQDQRFVRQLAEKGHVVMATFSGKVNRRQAQHTQINKVLCRHICAMAGTAQQERCRKKKGAAPSRRYRAEDSGASSFKVRAGLSRHTVIHA